MIPEFLGVNPCGVLFKGPECDRVRTNIVKEKDFLVYFIVLLVVRFDLRLISSIVILTFTSLEVKILTSSYGH